MKKTSFHAFVLLVCILFLTNLNGLFAFESSGLKAEILSKKNIFNLLPKISSITTILIENQNITFWGKFILGVFTLHFGLFLAKKRDSVFANKVMQTASFNTFDKKSFAIYFLMVAAIFFMAGCFKILGFHYQLTPFDIVGSFLSATFLAYLLESLERKSLGG